MAKTMESITRMHALGNDGGVNDLLFYLVLLTDGALSGHPPLPVLRH